MPNEKRDYVVSDCGTVIADVTGLTVEDLKLLNEAIEKYIKENK